MRCPRSRPRVGQRGAALIVALLVFAVCAALVVAMRSEFQRYFQRNANLFIAEQVQAYLRGAEQLATVVLLVDRDRDKTAERPRDDLTEIWAQPAQPYALDDGGWMQGSLEDLQGRFNLNALAQQPQEGAGENRFTPAQKQFIRLLQALGEPALSEYEAIVITRAVGDWVDADLAPAPEGAEDDYYAALTPAYRTANRPMVSVSELRAVANITPELYQALAPWVTVWPADPATLNIHTAPAMVLRSINANDNLSPLSEDEGLALEDYRRETGFIDKRDFLENPVFQGKGEMDEAAGLLGERSAYFLLRAEAEVADRNMRLYSVLERRNRAVTALARAGGSL
ncbi:MAG: type II secretion system minor pseudopilin GspK [Halioglobus sp.]